jgi:biopolymer transport protein ExbD
MSDQPTELDGLFRQGSDSDAIVAEAAEEPARRKRRPPMMQDKGIRDLNLTAMMDMMTIILVFLLKNYASTPENVQITDDLTPPRSSAKVPMDAAVTITITKKIILVDDLPVAEYNMATATTKGENPQMTSAPIPALAEVLDRKVADMKRLEQMGGAPFEGKVLIVADQTVTYAVLMRVLYTAGIAQFAKYKLVVRGKSDNKVMHIEKKEE